MIAAGWGRVKPHLRGIERRPSSRHNGDVLEALREIEASLRPGCRLTLKLQPLYDQVAEDLKAAARAARTTRDLFDRALDQRAERALADPLVREAMDYCARSGFEITNSRRVRSSRFEPPKHRWRPFVPNTAFACLRRTHPLGRLQRLLFERVFDRVAGTYVFPAAGEDSEFFDRHAFVTVAPHQERPRVPSGVRLRHVPKRAQDLTAEDLARAERGLGVAGAKRVLVLKGLQAILAPVELGPFVRLVGPEHVVVFGTAASGFAGRAVGLPVISDPLREAIEAEGFGDVTPEVFTEEELEALAAIHEVLESCFAWRTGLFPASQVLVYRRARDTQPEDRT